MCHHHRAAAWIHSALFWPSFGNLWIKNNDPLFSLIWYFISFSFHSRTFLGSLRLQSRRRRPLKRAKILHTEIAQRIRMKKKKNTLRNKISSANKQQRRSESSTYRDSKISALLSGSHRAAASSPRMASVDLIKTVFFSLSAHFARRPGKAHTHRVWHT